MDGTTNAALAESAMPPVENWKNQARAPPAGARTLWVGDLEEWMDECVPACPPAPARPAPWFSR